MAGFDSLYKQTVTLFNRAILGRSAKVGQFLVGVDIVGRASAEGDLYWVPTLLTNVHLIVDRSIIVSTYGEQSSDNARLHVRYLPSGGFAYVQGIKYYQPKEWKRLYTTEGAISFKFGDDFDFFVEGDLTDLGFVKDDDYRDGFYNYANKHYDNCFAITSVSKFNLIPHFEIGAK